MSALRRVHRASAIVLALYALVHLANHLAAVRSVADHIAFMDAVRTVTRLPLVEALLLGCAALQVTTGLALLVQGWGRRRLASHRLQAVSGAYLAFFLLVHVSSVLVGRLRWEVDTNFYFAAAGLHVAPFQLFFYPYYGLAVVAFVVHLAAVPGRLLARRFGAAVGERASRAGVVCGVVLAVLILAAFGGVFHPVVIPVEYRNNL